MSVSTDLTAAWEDYTFEARLRAMLEVSPCATIEDRSAQRDRAEQAFRTFSGLFLASAQPRPAAQDRRKVEGYLIGLREARRIARDYRVDEAVKHAEPSGAAAAARAIDVKITDLIEAAADA